MTEHLLNEIQIELPCPDCHYMGGCRCMTCGRCGNLTGNTTQGHYWKYCLVTQDMRTFHFCCPDNCELEVDKIA